jgi:hypothetical protein
MQRTSRGDCKAPEIVQGEAIRGRRSVPVGSCPDGPFARRSACTTVAHDTARAGALPGCGRVGIGTPRRRGEGGGPRCRASLQSGRVSARSSLRRRLHGRPRHAPRSSPSVPRERGLRAGETLGKAPEAPTVGPPPQALAACGRRRFPRMPDVPDHDRLKVTVPQGDAEASGQGGSVEACIKKSN